MAASMGGHLQDTGMETLTEDNRRTMGFVADLLNESTREAALLELSKKREQVPELAMILWHSFGKAAHFLCVRAAQTNKQANACPSGVMTSLMQEIISVYNLLNPSQLTAAASNRVCNALALLQCVASHNDTRTLFLNGARPPLLPYIYKDNADSVCYSAYPTIPLPVSQYDLQVSPF